MVICQTEIYGEMIKCLTEKGVSFKYFRAS